MVALLCSLSVRSISLYANLRAFDISRVDLRMLASLRISNGTREGEVTDHRFLFGALSIVSALKNF